MKKLDRAGVLVYASLAGLIGALVLNMVVVILWSLITGASPYSPVPAVAADTVAVEMSEMELHHWLAYQAAGAQNGPEANYHLEKALALATDHEHMSELEGLVRVYLPQGHFSHVQATLREWLGDRHEPSAPLDLLHASLVHLLLEEGNTSEARTQTEHLAALSTGSLREHGQEILEAQTKGDIETAKRLVAELIAEQQPHHAATPTTAPTASTPASTPTPQPMGGGMAGMGH